jgi:hypothetical protein
VGIVWTGDQPVARLSDFIYPSNSLRVKRNLTLRCGGRSNTPSHSGGYKFTSRPGG